MKKKLLAMIIMLCIAVSAIGTGALAYAEMNVTVNGVSMLLNSEYDASIIPSGFYEVAHEYEGETFYGGTDDDTSTIDLYYLTCDSDPSRSGWYTLENGSFVLYQTLSGETSLASDTSDTTGEDVVSVTATLTGSTLYSQAVALQIATPGSETSVPSGYVETTVAADNAYVTAYQKEDASGAALDAYLVYGTMDGSSFAWYVYDQSQETIQRYMNNAESQVVDQQEDIIDDLKAELEDLNTKYNNNVGRSKNMFIVACVVAVLFLLLMINAMIKRKHVEKDLEDRIVDILDNGEETQFFTKRERKHFDRLDAAARDRADRHHDRINGEDEYNYPAYGEEHVQKSVTRAPSNGQQGMSADQGGPRYQTRGPENMPVDAGKSGASYQDRGRSGSPMGAGGSDRAQGNASRNDMNHPADETVNLKSARPSEAKLYSNNARKDSTAAKQHRTEDSGFLDDDEEFMNRQDSGIKTGRNAYAGNDADSPSKSQGRPGTAGQAGNGMRSGSADNAKRTLTKESDLDRYGTSGNGANASAKAKGSGTNPESVFTNINESTEDMENAMKKIRSDRNVTVAAAGETMDFDLDLLEKNLGKMTSEVMDAPKPESKPYKPAVHEKPDAHEISEINKTPDFDSDFIDL